MKNLVCKYMDIALYNVGIVSSILICAIKWGWLDEYEVRRLPWMPSGGCYFCLGFWLTVIKFTLLYAVSGWEWSCVINILGYGFFSAPFINMIVGYARGQVRGSDNDGV